MIRQYLDKLNLPKSPGVYFFRDTQNKILYIGKATNLRDRVRSYFALDLISTRGLHIVDMVFKANTVSFQETTSVLEALILEANLIKKYKPYFNTKEKDDKSFNCVVITNEEYPRIFVVRQKDINTKTKTLTSTKLGLRDTSYESCFGPYPNSSSIKEALKIIRKIFPYLDRVSLQKDKKAFYQQIGFAPDVSSADGLKIYKKNVASIKLILKGKISVLLQDLRKQMNTFANQQKFEEASDVKNKIFYLEHIQDISLIKRDLNTYFQKDVFRIEAYDIAHLSGKNMVGVMVVIENDVSRKSEYRKFIIKGFTVSNDPGALTEILTRRLKHTEWAYPHLVVVDGNEIQINAAKKVFEEQGVSITIVSVKKDIRHKPIAILGKEQFIEKNKYAILLANSEAHRFAIEFHRERRKKEMLK